MILGLLTSLALGHDFAPSVLALDRLDESTWQVRWRPSPTDLGQSVFLEPTWPEECVLEGDRLRCPHLDRVAVPDVVHSVAGVLVRLRDGEREAVGVLTPGQPEWMLPTQDPPMPRWRARALQTVLGAWAVMGSAHFLEAGRGGLSRGVLWLLGVAGAVGVVAALAGCHQ